MYFMVHRIPKLLEKFDSKINNTNIDLNVTIGL